MRSRCKIQLVALVDQLFPELHAFFRSGIHIKTSYALLKRYPSPCDVAKLHLTCLINLLHRNSRGKYTREDAISLKALADSSVGLDNPILALQIRQTVERIELFTRQIADVEAAISEIMLRSGSRLHGARHRHGQRRHDPLGDRRHLTLRQRNQAACLCWP